MPHAWNQTITINKDIAKKLVTSQFNLKIKSIELLGEGFDNQAYLINKKLVFRFPRRKEGIECLENEILLLPFLALHLSSSFSNPTFIGKASHLYPFPFAGYPKLKGNPLYEIGFPFIKKTSFARTLGSWLRELHSIKVNDKHIKLIKGDQTWRLNVKQRLSFCQEKIKQYEQYFSTSQLDTSLLSKTIKKLSKFNFTKKKLCYLHGDLYSSHILVDNELNLTGLIDWGDVHIGHPGIDLIIIFNMLDDKVHKDFLQEYGQVDEEIISAALFRAFCHAISLLPYTYIKVNEKLKLWAITTINRTIDIIS